MPEQMHETRVESCGDGLSQVYTVSWLAITDFGSVVILISPLHALYVSPTFLNADHCAYALELTLSWSPAVAARMMPTRAPFPAGVDGGQVQRTAHVEAALDTSLARHRFIAPSTPTPQVAGEDLFARGPFASVVERYWRQIRSWLLPPPSCLVPTSPKRLCSARDDNGQTFLTTRTSC